MYVKVRARLQSAQLLSDMESFKAANPGCCLADFVRWHSPRDWEEGAGLSSRMRLPNNMWTELWDQVSQLPNLLSLLTFQDNLLLWTRSSRVVKASDSQCRSRNCTGFDPSRI